MAQRVRTVADRARATLSNGLWAASLAADAQAFHHACAEPEASQQRLLRRLMRRAAASAIGNDYDLARVGRLADLRHALPLGDHASHLPYLQRVEAGEPNVLGSDRVLALEPTSGSTAGAKRIPTTRGLRRAFGRAIAPWIVDLFRHEPLLMAGPAYWSLSPALQRASHSAGGVPIGFDADTAYLGRVGAALASGVLAVPDGVRTLRSASAFRHVSLLHLVASEHLRLVSVWNPSFFTILLDTLQGHAERLVDDLERGTCTPPDGPPLPTLARSPDRAAATRLRTALSGGPDDMGRALWPGLRLVSCWADAAAERPARELARRLPQASLQGKGLIATEAFVTLPLMGEAAPVLALRSHVFEFLDASGDCHFAHQLEPGATYEVVVTTGVLYRYRLGDLVRVEGRYRRTPTLRFLGRVSGVSDHVGEKLHEPHVRDALEAACQVLGLEPRFALLACDTRGGRPAYRLYLEGVPPERHADLLTAFEQGLSTNPHYAYARALGQLGPPRVVAVTDGAARVEAAAAARGLRRGDVKPTVLSAATDWHEALCGVDNDRAHAVRDVAHDAAP
jgi:hypothetical protein